MNYLPEGRPPVDEDLQPVIADDPKIAYLYRMKETNILTDREFLLACVLVLADHNAYLLKKLMDQSFTTKVVVFNKEANVIQPLSP